MTLSAPGRITDLLVRPIPPDHLELSWLPTSEATTLEAIVTDSREDGSSVRALLPYSIDHKKGTFTGLGRYNYYRKYPPKCYHSSYMNA